MREGIDDTVKNSNFEPLVSVVVPVYGTESFFDRCIRSLQAQSYKNLEIIIVNDGSQGNISSLVQAYLTDSRIHFIDNKKNQGLLRARVCGSKAATGDFIAFVDSDDYVSFDFYRTLVQRGIDSDADIVIGKTVWQKGNDKYVYNLHEAGFHFNSLVGNEIKKSFFSQEYQCYSWHTIWNKLYRKKLWDKCLPEFEKVDRHVVMTEDIFFSSILFYNAKKIVHTDNDAYFYCVNETASTNSSNITLTQYRKKLGDIKYAFDTVGHYLDSKKADQFIMDGIAGGRRHYARMWKNLAENAFSNDDRDNALTMVKDFCDDLGKQEPKDDYFFESIKTPWSGGLEYIKEQINNSAQEYISFDIFDTLVKRPFYSPKDIFKLLDEAFYDLTGNNISFSDLRTDAENMARTRYGEKCGFEDITLDEIYDFITEEFGISINVAESMKQLEIENEKKYCVARNAGIELYQLAKHLGKKIILITDMYLDRRTIESILKSCGITGYERLFISCEERQLKYNGHLFVRALSSLKISSNELLHIGDSWKSDIEGSNIACVNNIFFPSPIEVFEGKIQGYPTNRCAEIGKDICESRIDYSKAKTVLGFRCMQALAANYYFDNPYRAFNIESDFNIDPYFIGYYLLGMHSLGLTRWVNSQVADHGAENVLFLSRDGYLPMNIYSIMQGYPEGGKARPIYVQASRKALLPIMVKDSVNLYQLPVEYRAHSPKTLITVLTFLGNDRKIDSFLNELKEAGIDSDEKFRSKEKFYTFIHLYIQRVYDYEKHDKAKKLVIQYYKRIPKQSIAFDMGYSGRIQAAICEASGQKIDVLFLHEDYGTSVRMKKNGNFDVFSFYNYHPTISGLMREHIFSDCNGSCIGFEEKDNTIKPLLEGVRHELPDQFVVRAMQRGAADFVKDFMNSFSRQSAVMDFSAEEASIPFEGFLRTPGRMDMHIFSASYFEDFIFGAREHINIEAFAMQNLAALGWNPKTREEIEAEKRIEEQQQTTKEEENRILTIINHSSKVKRAIVWFLLDWKFFKEKFSINFRHKLKG